MKYINMILISCVFLIALSCVYYFSAYLSDTTSISDSAVYVPVVLPVEALDEVIVSDEDNSEKQPVLDHDASVVIQSHHGVQDDEFKTITLHEKQATQQAQLLPSGSFVTMQIHVGSQLDHDTQKIFDMLIGSNIDGLLDSIAQSNNNILSTEICKTCAIDTILKKVSKHKKLSEQELIALQHVVSNLYKFVNVMQKLGNKSILTAEQYLALKNLNESKACMNNLKHQARQATRIAALQTLQNIDMVQRQG